MSSLPAETHVGLTRLLQALSSAENDRRSQAEEALNSEWVAVRPHILLLGLAEQMQGASDESVGVINMPSQQRKLIFERATDTLSCSCSIPPDSDKDPQAAGGR